MDPEDMKLTMTSGFDKIDSGDHMRSKEFQEKQSTFDDVPDTIKPFLELAQNFFSNHVNAVLILGIAGPLCLWAFFYIFK